MQPAVEIRSDRQTVTVGLQPIERRRYILETAPRLWTGEVRKQFSKTRLMIGDVVNDGGDDRPPAFFFAGFARDHPQVRFGGRVLPLGVAKGRFEAAHDDFALEF